MIIPDISLQEIDGKTLIIVEIALGMQRPYYVRSLGIREPSCGIGNFFGLLLEKFGDADLHGVELDSITGRIAGRCTRKRQLP